MNVNHGILETRTHCVMCHQLLPKELQVAEITTTVILEKKRKGRPRKILIQPRVPRQVKDNGDGYIHFD